VVLPYEITAVQSVGHIPPYVPKYELTPQGDLMADPDIAAAMAAR
jgi:hypothetical protein